MTRKTTQSKNEELNSAIGSREERVSLSEGRDMLYEKFRGNISLLIANEKINAVELARKLSLKSGTRLMDLRYGRGNPTIEEMIILSKYWNVTIDELLSKEAVITFK